MLLSNNILELEIQKPHECYHNVRFDWTGRIVQISFQNKTFCTTENKNPKDINRLGRGLYNEFGIDKPVGYEDCKVGDKFLKIGVGWLLKENEAPYIFHKPYQGETAETEVIETENAVTFISQVKPHRGYGYKLTKRIELEGASFSISYSLQNIGTKPIVTSEYVHNFLSINENQIDENYRLKFPFPISRNTFGEFVNPENVVNLGNDSISWNQNPTAQFFISNIQSDKQIGTSWALEHTKEKVGIKETVNFEIQQINLWGDKHVVSPEIFYPINIQPNETANWQRHYKLYKI